MRNILIKILLLLLIISGADAQDSKKIAYSSTNSANGFLQIFSMDTNGTNNKQLTRMKTNCYNPKWSPDGKSIVFQTDNEELYLIKNVDSTEFDPFYLYKGSNPIFTHDGQNIIFNSEYKGYLSIYYMQPDDIEPSTFELDGYSNQQVLSKDDSKMIFSSFDMGSKSVFLMDLNPSNDTDDIIFQISENTNSNLEPDISSDNNMFAYASFNSELKGTIYVNIDGKEKPITKGSSWTKPKFSPDDSKLACLNITDEENVKLFVMDLDGGN